MLLKEMTDSASISRARIQDVLLYTADRDNVVGSCWARCIPRTGRALLQVLVWMPDANRKPTYIIACGDGDNFPQISKPVGDDGA